MLDEENEQTASRDALLQGQPRDITLGLSQEEVAAILARDGKNVITTEKPLTWYGVLIACLLAPFNFILLFLGIIAVATQDYTDFVIMMLMIFLSVVLRFWQEMKAGSEAESLKKLVRNKATVIRRRPLTDIHLTTNELQSISMGAFNEVSGPEEVLMEDIVVGDIIKLAAGDMIPGDVRLIKAKDLFVSQSALTGEAMPVEKLSTDDLKSQRDSKFDSKMKINFEVDDDAKKQDNLFAALEEEAPPPTRWQRIRAFITRQPLPQNTFKKAVVKNQRKHQLERQDLCFMGSSVVSGTGLAIVEATGVRTLFGELASQLSQKRPTNAFQKGVKAVSVLLIKFMAFMVPVVFILNGAITGQWLNALLFATAVAVGLTPEMLPMIVNANLARGAYVMSRKKTIVKKMESIMNFGAMNILCTDKTGTLTQDKVVLLKHMNLDGAEYSRVVEYAYLNSYFQTGLRNLLDIAVINYMEKSPNSPLWADVRRPANSSEDFPPHTGTSGRNYEDMDRAAEALRAKYLKIDEIPFDFIRRRMSVVLEKTESADKLLVCKGAVEEVLNICDLVEDPTTHKHVPFLPEVHARIADLGHRLNREGLRVIAVAYKPLERDALPGNFKIEDEKNMVFVGFTAFLDPPKESTAPAIKELIANGVTCKVLTGDSDEVCKTICEQVSLPVTGVITGKQLEERIGAAEKKDPFATPAISPSPSSNNLKAAEAGQSSEKNVDPIKNERQRILDEITSKTTIFAKLTPLQKAEVVRSLRRQGNVVGFLGDGINDAAALREADVGISVDSAVDVAKENADIILLEKSLLVLVKGVRQGRLTYGNTIKYIKMTASSNFGNVFSVLIASAWLPFLPMQPVQLLAQNLLYDFTQVIIPWDNVDEDFLREPRAWSAGSLGRFMACIGPISSIFDVITFLTMWYFFGIQTDASGYGVSFFNTCWFVEGLLTQTLIIHMIRSDKIPPIQTRASLALTSATLIVMGVGIGIPYTPLGTVLGMVPLPAIYYPFLAANILTYFVLTQIAKVIYIRVFGNWM